MTKSARIYRGTHRNLVFLARRLREGDLIGIPTETVYGLAANALDAAAGAKIFKAKRRPMTDPLIVHIHDIRQLAVVAVPNLEALKLARAFWPGPFTMILPKTSVVPDVITAGRPNVAVRMPRHPLLRRLLKLAGVPLAAPSANPFGYVSPTTAGHVRDGLGRRIAAILDGGPAAIGLESTILDLRDPRRPRLLRPGAVTREQIERVLRRKIAVPRSAPNRVARAQVSPGQLPRHYSPRTPVVLHDPIAEPRRPGDAYLYLCKPPGRSHQNVFWLDRRGNLRAAGRRLFQMLRKLDGLGYRAIHVEFAHGEGLADAINDRLRRAAAR